MIKFEKEIHILVGKFLLRPNNDPFRVYPIAFSDEKQMITQLVNLGDGLPVRTILSIEQAAIGVAIILTIAQEHVRKKKISTDLRPNIVDKEWAYKLETYFAPFFALFTLNGFGMKYIFPYDNIVWLFDQKFWRICFSLDDLAMSSHFFVGKHMSYMIPKLYEHNSLVVDEMECVFLRTYSDELERFIGTGCLSNSQEDCSLCEKKHLPNYTCSALCASTGNQCKRIRQKSELFCSQHLRDFKENPPEKSFPLYNPRQTACNDMSPQEFTRVYHDDFNVLRYHDTGRPIVPMRYMHKGLKCDNKSFYLPVSRVNSLFFDDNDHEAAEEACGKFYYYEPSSVNYLNLGNCRVFPSKVAALTSLLNEYLGGTSWYKLMPGSVNLKYTPCFGPVPDDIYTGIETKNINYEALTNEMVKKVGNFWQFRDWLIDFYLEDNEKILDHEKGMELFEMAKAFQTAGMDIREPILCWYIESFRGLFLSGCDYGPYLPYIRDYYFQLYLYEKDIDMNIEPQFPPAEKKVNPTPCGVTVTPGITPLHAMWPMVNPDSKRLDNIGNTPLNILDVDICRLACTMKIDTVIFQHELGGLENNKKTEIYDVRSTAVNFENVCRFRRPNPNKVPANNSKYPKIWFPLDTGLITRKEGHNNSPYMFKDFRIDKQTGSIIHYGTHEPSMSDGMPLRYNVDRSRR